jgi:uracil-DNA glycosylase family 4
VVKLADMALNDLYAKPKITSTVEAVIHVKEDFSKISPTYCEKVCKLKCKQYESVFLAKKEVDILIIQDHAAPDGKWDKFEGQQEKLMQDIIFHLCKAAGFGNLTYRMVDLLKCSPTEADFPNGKAPTATTLMKCRPYLWQEIESCKPKVIISLATAVTKALGYKKHSNTGNRGEYVDNVVITIHPRALTMIRQNASGAFWGQELYGVILRDFKKAAAMVRGELKPPKLEDAVKFYRENRIRVAESIEDVKKYVDTVQSLPPNSIISFDTETTSLDGLSEDARLLTIQFGFRDPVDKEVKAVVIPLWHRCNTAYDAGEAWELVKPILESDRAKCGHNSKFDILYIWFTTGVRVKNVAFDTLLVLHSLDSGAQGTFGLKAATWDIVPWTGLGGYENSLPALTKAKNLPSEEEESEEVESEE